MSKKLLLCTIMLASAVLSGAALAEHGKAGLWNISSTMTMAAMPQIPPEAMAQMRAMGMKMPMGGQTFTSQICMTEAEVHADKPPRMGREDSDCKWNNTQISASGMSADLVCSGTMKGTGTVQVSYSGPEHYSGQYAFKGSMDGHPADMNTTFSGVWVKADCGAVKPAAQ